MLLRELGEFYAARTQGRAARLEPLAVQYGDYASWQRSCLADPPMQEMIAWWKARLTGCPVLVNTSFNVRGEPIVGSPEDAFRCFMGTEIEVLAVGNCLMRKEAQPAGLRQRYEGKFELD